MSKSPPTSFWYATTALPELSIETLGACSVAVLVATVVVPSDEPRP